MSKNIDTIRHSTAHLFAAAVQELYPKTKFGVGLWHQIFVRGDRRASGLCPDPGGRFDCGSRAGLAGCSGPVSIR